MSLFTFQQTPCTVSRPYLLRIPDPVPDRRDYFPVDLTLTLPHTRVVYLLFRLPDSVLPRTQPVRVTPDTKCHSDLLLVPLGPVRPGTPCFIPTPEIEFPSPLGTSKDRLLTVRVKI